MEIKKVILSKKHWSICKAIWKQSLNLGSKNTNQVDQKLTAQMNAKN